MEKINLPKEVAEAIEDFRRTQSLNRYILSKAYINDMDDNANERVKVVHKFCSENSNFEMFLQALVNGYEIEQTPEEKLRELYKKWTEQHETGVIDRQDEISGMVQTLSILGITIEGVNT